MTNLQNSSHQEALTVIQQAVSDLANWAGLELNRPNDSDAIEEAKRYLQWPSDCTPRALRLLFDSVKLSLGQDKQYFWRSREIESQNPTIPYPQLEEPTTELETLKEKIHKEISFLKESPQDWQNLSLLTLILEKFGSFISYGESDVALIDKARTTAAVAAAIANLSAPYKLSIVAGDLSGIQKFIYTISSDGALKSLRARSFYLELVTEEVVQQLLEKLKLPRTNVIYAGGGNLYILAPGTEETKNTVRKVRQQFNKWLIDEFQGKVYLALDSSETSPIEDIATKQFADHWSNATKTLAKYKSRKFGDQLSDLSRLLEKYYAHTPCQVCHRDDEENLQPLNQEPGAVQACGTCRRMYKLGGQLLRVDAIVRSQLSEAQANDNNAIEFKLPATEDLKAVNVRYCLFDNWKQIVPDSDTILLVNDWELDHYRFRHFRNLNSAPLLLGNYAIKSQIPEETGFMRAEEMAELSHGIKRLGYLRMDVDRLGQIFAKGLGENQTLPRLAGLSRQMSYFFKVYLNSLAANNEKNIPTNIKRLPQNKDSQTTQSNESTSKNPSRILLFIYAGGDDLFISGAWNQVVEFGFDVYQCFRAYTGYNPDITLSGGISIADNKFPLYQAADESGEAEEAAKQNGRDSLGLFGEVFKWHEWLGIENINLFDSEIKEYLKVQNQPKLLGVLPFVNRLEQENIGINYSRNFVRNLLITAQIQEQSLRKFTDRKSEEAMGTRYYLHLPKIAYTLARLPQGILKDEEFRTSLKNPYNAPYFRAIATWIELLNRNS
ncbi:MAG: type III-A CRISPR-associated protein Cas10/Csm1 [Aulosira sp. ZfuVER01]|nr:type III-A CRISPR-associated protein Cas10/Csm1 [Aulosira sp. ZfuVER01]MDZ7997607.1 type III-A CRISPR-associated protein Cas10/Csm1 [Aulosira sp. DedVER01a]MDZ8054609.1 type III-A CRISPR-associated protein Cas10/Csm1 [Aulosira sp. ZfuCHP01]